MPALQKALLAALVTALPLLASADEAFVVVAHPAVQVERLTRAELSRLFLKRDTRWPDGQGVLVVEPADPELRKAFAARVHGKSLGALRSYWNQMIFGGHDVPPVEKPSDEAVVAYVREHPGAVGYASPSAATGRLRLLSVEKP